MRKLWLPAFLTAVIIVAAAARPAAAQTDEIQVYDGSLAAPGKINLTWHNNFTPDGAKTPSFPGAIISNHSYNATTEWAFGITDWFEGGIYLPLYSVSKGHGATLNGAKLRALFAVPHADDRTFFYGVNFEFSFNNGQWDQRAYTSEIRPIVGWHLGQWDLIFNPILDNSYYGGPASLDFAPSTRIAYNFTQKFALAAEEYADMGELRAIEPVSQQFHQVWATMDYKASFADIEAGIGFGLNNASDRTTLKLMFSRDLN